MPPEEELQEAENTFGFIDYIPSDDEDDVYDWEEQEDSTNLEYEEEEE